MIDDSGDLFLGGHIELYGQARFGTSLTGVRGSIEAKFRTTTDPDHLLMVSYPDAVDPADDSEIRIESASVVRFLADHDQDTSEANVFHWSNGTASSINKAAILKGNGDLRLAGTLTESQSLDLAESFVAGEDLEPGDVVRISPEDPHTVLLSRGESDGTILGVVSARPGVVLGGAPFRVAALEETWGPEVADAYRSRRPALQAEVLRRTGSLADRASQVVTREGGVSERGELVERRSAAMRFEADLEAATIEEFFRHTFVQVALAGRVPVRVDASFGPIRPGDPLTASPTPGVAMKANAPGPILGTALEALEEGEGKVTICVHRGWYGGAAGTPGSRLATRKPEAERALRSNLRERDAEIAALRERLARLERTVTILTEAARAGDLANETTTVAETDRFQDAASQRCQVLREAP